MGLLAERFSSGGVAVNNYIEGLNNLSLETLNKVFPAEVSAAEAPKGPVDVRRKIITARRKLLTAMKSLCADLDKCSSGSTFAYLSIGLKDTRMAYDSFLADLNTINDAETLKELTLNLADMFEQCVKSYELGKLRLFKGNVSHNTDETDFDDDNIKPSDSVSQVLSKLDLSVVSSNTAMIRRIEIERKKAELEHIEELTRARRTRMLLKLKRRPRPGSKPQRPNQRQRPQRLVELKSSQRPEPKPKKLRLYLNSAWKL